MLLISGTCLSSSIFMTTKSIEKTNLPTLISTSLMIPLGWANVLSTIYRVIVVGVSSPKLSLLTTDRGIKLMLVLESHSAFPISAFPIMQGIVKLHGSCLFSGMDFLIIELQVAFRLIIPSSANFLFLLNGSFMNFS